MKKGLIAIFIVVVVFFGSIVYMATWRPKLCSSCMRTKDVTTIPVPLQQGEDIVRNFFELIGEKRPSEAAAMMLANDDQKEEWAVQFNAIETIKINNVETTGKANVYKVNLAITMKPEATNAPVPFYGWDNGENIRWVSIVKESDLWKIQSISTGP